MIGSFEINPWTWGPLPGQQRPNPYQQYGGPCMDGYGAFVLGRRSKHPDPTKCSVFRRRYRAKYRAKGHCIDGYGDVVDSTMAPLGTIVTLLLLWGLVRMSGGESEERSRGKKWRRWKEPSPFKMHW